MPTRALITPPSPFTISYIASSSFVSDGYLHLRTQWNPTRGIAHDGTVKVTRPRTRTSSSHSSPFNLALSPLQLFNFTSGWVDTSRKFAQHEGNCSPTALS